MCLYFLVPALRRNYVQRHQGACWATRCDFWSGVLGGGSGAGGEWARGASGRIDSSIVPFERAGFPPAAPPPRRDGAGRGLRRGRPGSDVDLEFGSECAGGDETHAVFRDLEVCPE